jgi:hypothetical protein
MSEYQYYEFLAVDRPLTRKQIDEVREFSTRAEITSTRFVNQYHWGDFRGDPDLLVSKYFDLMLYYANWGTHRLLIGLPQEIQDVRSWRQYESEYGLEIRKPHGGYVIDFSSGTDGDDNYGEENGDPSMSALASIRGELLAGDLRPLFLGWLAGVSMNEKDEGGEPVPPIPPGLGNLTPAQQELADFLRVDGDLLDVAAKQSPDSAPPAIAPKDWIAALPTAEKDQILIGLVNGADPSLAQKFVRRYRSESQPAVPEQSSRKVQSLLDAAASIRQEREAAERAAREREKRKREKEAAEQRERHLKDLMARLPQVWRQVEQHVEAKNAKGYDEAVKTLRDLREVAVRKDALRDFETRVLALREAHRSKPTFVERLDKAGLLAR